MDDRAYVASLMALKDVIASEMSVSVDTYVKSGGKFHTKKDCDKSRAAGAPENCFLHNPSDHAMRDWKMVMRSSTLIERICPHGVGHPDPDSAAYMNWRYNSNAWGVHGCDFCCGQYKPN